MEKAREAGNVYENRFKIDSFFVELLQKYQPLKTGQFQHMQVNVNQ